MLYIPKQTKYRKMFKIFLRTKNKKNECRSNFLAFGSYGIFSTEFGLIKPEQIESVRRLLNKRLKKVGNYWIRIFPFIPVTKKPVEVRMGKGKGNVSFWVFPIVKGRILFEFNNLSFKEAQKLFISCSYKLPVKTKLVYKKYLF